MFQIIFCHPAGSSGHHFVSSSVYLLYEGEYIVFLFHYYRRLSYLSLCFSGETYLVLMDAQPTSSRFPSPVLAFTLG